MLGVKSINITQTLLHQISDIDEFKGFWTGLDKHTTGLKFLADVTEHGAQLERVLQPLQHKGLDPDIICLLNAMLLGEQGLSVFKNRTVPLPFSHKDKVFGVLDTAEPDQVKPLLSKLCDWVNESLEKQDVHPLLVAAVFNAIFLQVGPFTTGNQRTARFLTVFILLKAGYIYAPYVSLGPLFENKMQRMYEALKHNQNSLEEGRPDWSEWLPFYLDVLQDQKQGLLDRLESQETELKELSDLAAKIMALFKEHKRLQMKEIIQHTRGRRATIKIRLQELLEGGYIKRHGAGRATWYSLV